MARYVALLRGVSPQNANMPQLKRCFEAAGFTQVRTLLSSGNVVFDAARAASEAALARRAVAAMEAGLGRSFPVLLRQQRELQQLLAADPFARFELPSAAKRVVSFLREPPASVPALPIEQDGARLLALLGRELYTAYLPGDKGPVFMALIDRHFGSDLTTRSWDTVAKCAVA